MSVVDKLKDLVYSQKRKVSIRDICRSLNIHISEAQSAIDEFVAEESKKDDSQLDVTYALSGSGLETIDDCKVFRLTFAKAEELEEIRKGFAAITFTKIYSVSLKNVEPVVGNDLNSEEPLLDRDDILKQQKLTYIVNDKIQIRPDRLERLKLFSGIPVNNDTKVEVKKETKEIKTESKKDTKSSTKTSNRRRNENKKQGKLSCFGTKANKKSIPNSSGDSGFSVESTPDPFTDDEEEKSPEREEEQEMEVEPSPVSPPPEVESEDEKPKRKKIEDSEDEAVDIKETKKTKKDSKKRKRVRVYDSDEEDEDTLAMKILAGEDDSNHSNATRPSLDSIKSEEESEEEKEEEILPSKKPRKKSKPSQPMETKTVSEEFVDDEGYTQVRYVKKLVPVEEKEEGEEKKSETIENGADKKETKTKVKTEKPAHKKQKTGDAEEEDSKPKGKKITKAAQAKKGLVSITSFFKPAAKV